METNKQLILDLYSNVFGQGDMAFADAVIAENYIQHNPIVKTGKSGFMEFLRILKQLPKPENPQKPFKRVIAEGDFVAVHSKIEFMGKDHATFDLFRIENGLIVEHWDAVQVIVESIPIVTGTIDFDNNESSEANKRIVEKFVEHVFIGKLHNKFKEFASANVDIKDFTLDFDSFKLHRTIGERNFVATQSEVRLKGVAFVVYDIFRLSNSFIVEHWVVQQKIPSQMAHSNGMI